jgi:hypothetical protein
MLKNKFTMGNKGMNLVITITLFTIISVVAILAVFTFFVLGHFSIKAQVQEEDINRHAFTYANVLLSSDKLVYDNGNEVFRGIFDKNKLDKVQSNPNPMFDTLSYPASSAAVTVEDLDSNTKWSFNGNGPSSIANLQSQESTFQVVFPVVIKSGNDFDIGRMTLKLTEKSLA